MFNNPSKLKKLTIGVLKTIISSQNTMRILIYKNAFVNTRIYYCKPNLTAHKLNPEPPVLNIYPARQAISRQGHTASLRKVREFSKLISLAILLFCELQ